MNTSPAPFFDRFFIDTVDNQRGLTVPVQSDQEDSQPLYELCDSDDVDIGQISSKFDTFSKRNKKDDQKWGAMLYAVKHNNKELVDFFCKKKFQVDDEDKYHYTPVIYACIYGFPEILEILLKVGNADPNHKDSKGNTALALCIGHNKSKLQKELEEKQNEQKRDKNKDSYEQKMQNELVSVDGNMIVPKEQPLVLSSAKSINTKVPAELFNESTVTEKCIEILLCYGADPNISSKEKITPLMRAAEKNYAEVISILLGKYNIPNIITANVNARDKEGRTALMFAVKNSNYDSVIKLFESDIIDPTIATNRKVTPLMIAADKGDTATLLTFKLKFEDLNLDFKKEIEKTDDADNSTIHYAVRGGNKSNINLFLDMYPNFSLANRYGETPFMNAIKLHKTDMVKFLLENDFLEKEYKNNTKNGFSILHLASDLGFDDIVELILNKCNQTHINYFRKCSEREPIYYAGNKKVFDLLEPHFHYKTDSKGNVNYFEIVNFAAQRGHLEIVKHFLFEYQNIVNEKQYIERKIRTPLMIACEKGHVNVATWLIHFGFDVNAEVNDETALVIAAKNEQIETMKVLLKKGADINKRGPLEAAITAQKLESVKLLIWKGAQYVEPQKSSYAIFDFMALQKLE